jgi:hypothetical protein
MLSKSIVLSIMAIAALTGCLEAVDEAGVVTPGKTVTTPGTTPAAATTRSVAPRTLQTGADILLDTSSGHPSLGGTTFSSSYPEISLDGVNHSLRASANGSRTLFAISSGDPATESSFAYVAGTSGLSQGLSGARISRAGTSTLPTSGTASYSGDYAGLAFQNYQTTTKGVFQEVFLLTSGDVSLVTSFTSNRVDGKITNRQAFSTDGTRDSSWTAADIKINSATLTTNGDYRATLSGGGLSQLGDVTTTNNGQVAGIVGGINGQSTAGTLFLNHVMISNNADFALTERGAFSATR